MQQLVVENKINVEYPQAPSTLNNGYSYQASVNSIENELNAISDVLSSFNMFFPHSCIDEIKNIPIIDGSYDKSIVSKIYQKINKERHNLYSANIKMNMKTTIYANCVSCENNHNCEKSSCRTKFIEAYNRIYRLLFDVLNHLSEYLKIIDNNLLLESIITSNKRVIALITDDSEIAEYMKDIEDRTARIINVDKYIDQLCNSISSLNTVGFEDMNSLITESKQYIFFKKKDAKLQENGENILEYIPMK